MKAKRAKAARTAEVSPKSTPVPWAWILVALAIVLAGAIRYRLADVPLERDEGEYAYAGQLIRQGVPPYQLVYNMKFPGTYYSYALILAAFGETAHGIRIGLLLLNAATTLVVFLLGRTWFGASAGAIAAMVFAALSLDRWIQGPFAHATHFVVLPVLAAFLLLSPGARPITRLRCLLAGVLIGLAILMKQHGGGYLIAALIWLVWLRRRSAAESKGHWVNPAALVAGVIVPLAVVATVLASQGVFGRFVYWTLDYAAKYVNEVPLRDAGPAFMGGWSRITAATGWLWVLAGVGAVSLFLLRLADGARPFMVLLALGSVAALVPGFRFRSHYFIVLLPAAGLFAGLAYLGIGRFASRLFSPVTGPVVALLVSVGTLSSYVIRERDYLFHLTPDQVSRSVYSISPFVEAPVVARYLRDHTSHADRILVFGSEPEIYFLANRRSATGYVYTYPLMEPHAHASRMQEEMMREIEAAQPLYLVGVVDPWSWLVRPESDRRILTWFDRYARACYDIVGAASIAPAGTTFFWESDLPKFKPASTNTLYVHRRKSPAPCTVER